MKPRLQEKYEKEVRPALAQKRGYQNIHQVPRLEKIVVNMGVSASLEKGAIEDAAKDLAAITGVLFFVYLILAAQYESFLLPFAVILSLVILQLAQQLAPHSLGQELR